MERKRPQNFGRISRIAVATRVVLEKRPVPVCFDRLKPT
jgi:hypothetical protein